MPTESRLREPIIFLSRQSHQRGLFRVMPAASLLITLLLGMFITLTPASGAGVAWTKYVNARFGFVLYYPDSLEAGREPTNGGGREFHSHDNEFSVAASGGFLMLDDGDTLDKRWREELQTLGQTVTYKTKSASWYVISGVTAEGNEYYHKFYAHGANGRELRIYYPHSQSSRYDAWVTHIEKTFVPFLKGDYDRVP